MKWGINNPPFHLQEVMDNQSKLKIPQHIAIIMDGNGRWAKQRNLPRTQGHIEGVKRVEEIMIEASIAGVKVLTLFTFSTENWTRPAHEVNMLMSTLTEVLKRKIKQLHNYNVRFHFIGRKEGIPESVLKTIHSTIEETKNNTGLILNMAFNYGSRVEILEAVKKISESVKNGQLKVEDITEELFGKYLYTVGLPDPDLLIRTSGEKRISNFLLWQSSYTEFYFIDKYWPDFDKTELEKAILEYGHRERRYGHVTAQI